MKVLEASGSFNEIQLFRLKALRRALGSLDPFDLRALRLTYGLQEKAGEDLGLDVSKLPDRREFARALKPLARPPKTKTANAYAAITQAVKQKIVAEKPGMSWSEREELDAQIKGTLKPIIGDLLDKDTQQAQAQHQATIDAVMEIMDPAIQLHRAGSNKRFAQDQLISFAMSYAAPRDTWGKVEDKEQIHIPQEREKQKNIIVLNLVKKRYDRSLQILDRAIKEKEKRQRKNKERNPVTHNMDLIAESMGLSAVERDLMVFYADGVFSLVRNIPLILGSGAKLRDSFFADLGTTLGYTEEEIRTALDPSSQIRQANLLIDETTLIDKKDKKDKKVEDSLVRKETFADRSAVLDHELAARTLFIPSNTLITLRSPNSSIGSLLESLRGMQNPVNDFSLQTEFSGVADGAQRIAANLVADLLDPRSPGRKARYLAGPAGSGKNSLADVLGREVARQLNTHHGMNVTVRVEMVAMATGKDSYGKMKEEQLSGKDRVYAHKTADVLAANQNARVLEKKEGEIVILVVDEADRDMFNPELIGSKAKDGIKDLFNHHVTSLVTPCIFLLNAAHPDIAHVWRRVAVGLWLDVQGFEGRVRTVEKYTKEAGWELPPANIEYIAERYAHTPGVLEAIIKDVTTHIHLIEKEEDRKVASGEIVKRLEDSFAQYERVNNQGLRPRPSILRARPAFDFDLCRSTHGDVAADIRSIIEQPTFLGDAHSYLISGPDGIGKRTLVHTIAKEIAARKGKDRYNVLEIGHPLDGPTTDRAIADDAVVMVYNFPYEAIEFMDETTYPIQYAHELLNPVFYVVPSDTRLIHPHMTECLHLDFLGKKKTLLACSRIMPEFPIDPRIQHIKEMTLRDIAGLKAWAESHERRKGARPTPEELLLRMMDVKGIGRSTIRMLGGKYPETFTLADALKDLEKEKPAAAHQPEAGKAVILTHPRFKKAITPP